MTKKYKPDYSETPADVRPGNYEAWTVNCIERVGKKSGAPYLEWIFEMENEPGVFTMVSHTTPLQGRGANLLKKLLKAIDPSHCGEEFAPDSYMGRDVIVTVGYPILPDGQESQFPKVTKVMPALNKAGAS